MNAGGYTGADGSPAWRRYLTREHAARNQYLATTTMAQAEYLTGPWPDRDAYNAVERSAWMTYYAAGRSAWQAYRQEAATAALPPPRPTGDSGTYRPGGYLPDRDGQLPPAADPAGPCPHACISWHGSRGECQECGATVPSDSYPLERDGLFPPAAGSHPYPPPPEGGQPVVPLPGRPAFTPASESER